jgi:hypothetical protein
MTMSTDRAAAAPADNRTPPAVAGDIGDSGAGQPARPRPGRDASDRHPRGESRTRQEYADATRQDRAKAQADPGTSGEETGRTRAQQNATGKDNTHRPRDSGSGQPAAADAAPSAVTHFYGEFRGRPARSLHRRHKVGGRRYPAPGGNRHREARYA